jgi:hypothetical protein
MDQIAAMVSATQWVLINLHDLKGTLPTEEGISFADQCSWLCEMGEIARGVSLKGGYEKWIITARGHCPRNRQDIHHDSWEAATQWKSISVHCFRSIKRWSVRIVQRENIWTCQSRKLECSWQTPSSHAPRLGKSVPRVREEGG